MKKDDRYEYYMTCIETVTSTTKIRSSEELSPSQLRRITEKRRVDGLLTCEGVDDVVIFCNDVKRLQEPTLADVWPHGSNATKKKTRKK